MMTIRGIVAPRVPIRDWTHIASLARDPPEANYRAGLRGVGATCPGIIGVSFNETPSRRTNLDPPLIDHQHKVRPT